MSPMGSSDPSGVWVTNSGPCFFFSCSVQGLPRPFFSFFTFALLTGPTPLEEVQTFGFGGFLRRWRLWRLLQSSPPYYQVPCLIQQQLYPFCFALVLCRTFAPPQKMGFSLYLLFKERVCCLLLSSPLYPEVTFCGGRRQVALYLEPRPHTPQDVHFWAQELWYVSG